jgi:hypothetical protein
MARRVSEVMTRKPLARISGMDPVSVTDPPSTRGHISAESPNR